MSEANAVDMSRMVRWEPSETAPKDGTVFLAYNSKIENVVCPYELGYFYSGEFRDLNAEEIFAFDYWMPLPDAPNAKD